MIIAFEGPGRVIFGDTGWKMHLSYKAVDKQFYLIYTNVANDMDMTCLVLTFNRSGAERQC